MPVSLFYGLLKKSTAMLLPGTLSVMFSTGDNPLQNYHWKTLKTQGSALPREENDFVEVNGLFYLIAGRDIQPISVFNPKTLTWTKAAAPPIELHHFQAVVYHREIYLCGAMTAGYPHEKPVPVIYIYNPTTNQWRTGANIPANRMRGSGGTVLYKGKFYWVAGIKDGHWTGNVVWFDAYDPKTNRWTQMPDAPHARDHFRAVLAYDELYCIGGGQSDAMHNKGIDKLLTDVDIYNFKTGKWRTAPAQLPTPRSGCSAVLAGQDIVITGGESTAQETAHNQTEAYNLKTGKFTTLAPMVAGRHGTNALWYQHKMYTASGVGNRGGAPRLSSIECFSAD
jgi:N-acetylneuraminic acid mutarotase